MRQTDPMTASTTPSSYHYVVDEPLLRTIAAEIQAAIPGAQVRLFGSRARGTARPDSDLDLLVTVMTSQVLPASVEHSSFLCMMPAMRGSSSINASCFFRSV